MERKNTGELLLLMKNKRGYDEYIKENGAELVRFDSEHLSGELRKLAKAKGMRHAKVIRLANIAESTGYQIFRGERRPSRNKLIAICIALGLTAEETNRLLTVNGYGALYARNARDNVILYALENGVGVIELELMLAEYGHDGLGRDE